MDNRYPSTFPRRILLAVTGLSPQIVTETLHALSQDRSAPFVPTEIHLITTAEGAERARLALLSDKPGWFHRLRKDLDLPEIAFDASRIHLLRDANGNVLPDIRTPEDNLACADFITEIVRQLSADPSSALHVSIAGGRKTMGFFLGYALSLFGRPQDRLSHVLVSDPFEGSWDFFYPTPYENIIEAANKKLVDTRDARLSLAEIPFVSLRHGLPALLLDGSARFEETVAAARASLGPAALDIDIRQREVHAAGKRFRLPPSELAILSVFARRAIEKAPPLPAPPKDAPDPAWAERFLRELRAIVGPMADISSSEQALRAGMDGHYFSQRLSKLHSTLKKQLGPAAGPYLIDGGDGKPHQYRLNLAPDAVRVLDPGRTASLRPHPDSREID